MKIETAAKISKMAVVYRFAHALEIEADAVFIRIIDVGAGHAAVVRMPGDQYMVFDVGNWQDGGAGAFEGVSAVVLCARISTS